MLSDRVAENPSGETRRSRLRTGCLALLALGGLALLWAGSLVGTAYWRGRTEVVERRELSSGSAVAGVESGAKTASGRVELNLTVGHFRVLRGDPGVPVQVVAEYDVRSYELEEVLTHPEGSPWTYRVTFREISWFKDGGLRALLGGSFPEIKIYLPPDVPLELVGKFGKGAAELELGGLWLTDIDLEFERGSLQVDFDRPLVAPAESLTLHARQGGLFAGSLGNASPRRLEIDHRMGGMTIDLGGEWTRDAEVRIASRMGAGEIRIPEDVRTEGLALGRGVAPERESELAPPTLKISVSSSFGGVSVED